MNNLPCFYVETLAAGVVSIQCSSGKLYHKGSPKVVQNSEQPKPMERKAIGQVAKVAKVSHDTIAKVKRIEERRK